MIGEIFVLLAVLNTAGMSMDKLDGRTPASTVAIFKSHLGCMAAKSALEAADTYNEIIERFECEKVVVGDSLEEQGEEQPQ